MRNSQQQHLKGVVERITYHNPENGWTVLKVSPFQNPTKLVAVIIHQAKVFAGATMEFWGAYVEHPQHGEQFKADKAMELQPATTAAIEKYLGSGLIKGVGPAIAKRIVHHFNHRTLDIFENRLDELLSVPGIAEKKMAQIRASWEEHRAIRDVMIFLQGHGVSTLFATKIYKTYGDKAIQIVSENPYRLAHDIYGIGFFSADKIALAMGFDRKGLARIEAGIKHVLAQSREEGHCFLTEKQILESTPELLGEPIEAHTIKDNLNRLFNEKQIKTRALVRDGKLETCFYSKKLFYDEGITAQHIKKLSQFKIEFDRVRIEQWVHKYCQYKSMTLSVEQMQAVIGIACEPLSILTGGPGCGKTTTTKVLYQLLKAMKKKVLLAAPTGRAAQRMSEVIGAEAKTMHRLLEWAPRSGGFNKNDKNPLDSDVLILDECSMIDISLAASLLVAVRPGTQVLLIGDPDQLPAVGAGDVLSDLIKSGRIKVFSLTQVFRQAKTSSIIRFAHEINAGQVPRILSPLAHPQSFFEGHDGLFVDADEATHEQIKFIYRARQALSEAKKTEGILLKTEEEWQGRLSLQNGEMTLDEHFRPPFDHPEDIKTPVFSIPDKFRHVDLLKLDTANSEIEELRQVLKKVHPWSSLHFGLTAVETVGRLYTQTLPKWLGRDCEIQVLTPQVRGTLGTQNLNRCLQQLKNPESPTKKQIKIGDKIFRQGDRVIQTRNNYDLGVFNGDIGHIVDLDLSEMTCLVEFSSAECRQILFSYEDLQELSLAYAITIHKSQGSEFQAIIIPVLGQHFNMLFRNLIYTGLTRAKKLAVFVGSRKAFAMAIAQVDNRKRQTALADLLREDRGFVQQEI